MPILGKHGGSTVWSFDQSLGVEFGAYWQAPGRAGGLGPTFARRDTNRLPAPKKILAVTAKSGHERPIP